MINELKKLGFTPVMAGDNLIAYSKTISFGEYLLYSVKTGELAYGNVLSGADLSHVELEKGFTKEELLKVYNHYIS